MPNPDHARVYAAQLVILENFVYALSNNVQTEEEHTSLMRLLTREGVIGDDYSFDQWKIDRGFPL